jgi:hypothetical protein
VPAALQDRLLRSILGLGVAQHTPTQAPEQVLVADDELDEGLLVTGAGLSEQVSVRHNELASTHVGSRSRGCPGYPSVGEVSKGGEQRAGR